MILLDTSALVAAMFHDQRGHRECAHVLEEAEVPLIISPFVMAETDYLIEKRAGVETELLFLEEVVNGAYQLALFGTAELTAARDLVVKYRSLGIGLADASIVVLAEQYGTCDILTLDERHFRAMKPLTGRKSFRLLPADA